jgi:hypothetical protein
MASHSPEERALIAKIAAHESWLRTKDRTARTAAGRRAFHDRFDNQVDPDGVLAPHERAILAEHARKAHYSRMALRSAQSRRRAADKRRQADELERAAAEAEAELAAEPVTEKARPTG